MATIYYEPTGCNCDGQEYSQDDIQTAATKALELASQGQTLGRDRYPHVYNDYEHFTFAHAQKPYLEFPIFAGNVYDGSQPGADRIVIGSIASDFSSAVYCAVITHDGQRKNGFAECQDDTMNLRGKGTTDWLERKQASLLARKDEKVKGVPLGRTLLSKIELK